MSASEAHNSSFNRGARRDRAPPRVAAKRVRATHRIQDEPRRVRVMSVCRHACRRGGPHTARRIPMLTLRLPDGSAREVAPGTRPRQVAESIGKRLAQAAVAARVDGHVVDLDREIEDDLAPKSPSQILTDRDADSLDVLRHSTAHIMARAVLATLPRRATRLRPDHRERLLLRHRRHPPDPRRRLPAHRGGDEEDRRRRRAVRALRAPVRRTRAACAPTWRRATRSNTSTTWATPR